MRVFVSLVVVCVAAIAWAQNRVISDQGKPGTQGPWPVTGSISVSFGGDGGFVGTVVTAPCVRYKETNTSVGATAALVPATPLANRIWVRICNSLGNAEGSQCVCSATTTPTFAASSLGDYLAVSDCVLYPVVGDAGVPICICNGAGIRLPAAECSLQ